jgi:hypothetical protein
VMCFKMIMIFFILVFLNLPTVTSNLYASADASLRSDLYECTGLGEITYEIRPFNLDDAEKELNIRQKIALAMDEALRRYNCYTDLKVHIKVNFDPNVPTAKGSWLSRSIHFGNIGMVHKITAMHEIAHVFGVGNSFGWDNLVQGQKFVGESVQALLRNMKDAPKTIYADESHFWPYGLNQASEVKSELDLLMHCLIVEAMTKDFKRTLGF